MTSLPNTIPATDEQLEAGTGSLAERALASYQRHVLDNYEHMSELRNEGARLQKFCSPVSAGQWDERVRTIFKQLGIPEKGINETWPTVMAAIGPEKIDRFEPDFTGRDAQDQEFADAVNATVRKVRDQAQWKARDSAAFKQAMIQRVGALEVWVDLWSAREPKIQARKVPLGELMLDFYGDEGNYDDMAAISRGRWVNWAEWKRHHHLDAGKWQTLVNELEGGSADYESGDVWHSSVGREGINSAFYRRRTREIFEVNHEWRERRKIIELDLPGELAISAPLPMEFPDELAFFQQLAQAVAQIEQQLEQAATMQVPEGQPPPEPLPVITREVTSKQLILFKSAYIGATSQDYTKYFELEPEVVYKALIVGDHVIRVEEARDRNWSLFPLTAFVEESPDIIVPHGFVDVIKSRQEWLNQFLALWVHTMAHMSKARVGVDLDKVSPEEITQMNADAARGDTVIGLRGGKDAIFDWPRGYMPDGIQEAWQIIFELVPGAAGQSRYSIGSVQDLRRTAARLVDQQVGQTAKTLAEPYDHLGQWRSKIAKKIAGLVFIHYSDQQFAKAAGDYAPAIPFDRSLWKGALEMDVTVGEKVSTKDMAESTMAFLNQTGMWEWVRDTDPEALAEIMTPLVGSKVGQGMIEKIQLQEPQRLLEALAEMYGQDPAALQQFLEGAAAQEQGAF